MAANGYKEYASMAEVIRLCGGKWTPAGTDEVRGPCPVCGAPRKVILNLKKGFGKCWGCDTHFNYTSYYAATFHVTNKEAKRDILAQLGRSDDYVAPKAVEEPEEPIADIEVRNRVYSALLQKCELGIKQRTALHDRGLTDDEIDALEYKTYPKNGEEIARLLMKDGYCLRGIPGFYKNERNNWELRPLKTGIMIPFRDINGYLQGFQIRKDDDLLKQYEDGRKEQKCNWVSSKKMKEGTGAKGFVHFACDFYFDFAAGKELPIIPNDTLLITEGGMKADIIHLLSGFAVIAVPGVYNLKELKKNLTSLQKLGVKCFINCFDMDFVTNEDVARACEKLQSMICEAGFQYKRWTWQSKIPDHKPLKGLDDFLAYRKRNI